MNMLGTLLYRYTEHVQCVGKDIFFDIGWKRVLKVLQYVPNTFCHDDRSRGFDILIIKCETVSTLLNKCRDVDAKQ